MYLFGLGIIECSILFPKGGGMDWRLGAALQLEIALKILGVWYSGCVPCQDDLPLAIQGSQCSLEEMYERWLRSLALCQKKLCMNAPVGLWYQTRCLVWWMSLLEQFYALRRDIFSIKCWLGRSSVAQYYLFNISRMGWKANGLL